MMSCAEILFSVPASSSAPQRPQFFKRSDADWISWSVTLSFVFVMGLGPQREVLDQPRKRQDYHQNWIRGDRSWSIVREICTESDSIRRHARFWCGHPAFSSTLAATTEAPFLELFLEE